MQNEAKMHKNVKKFSLLNFVKKSEKYRRKVNPLFKTLQKP